MQIIGPYSPAVKIDKMVFTSGQLGLNEKSELVSDKIEDQTRQALKNLKAVLDASGVKPENVVKTTIFLSQMSDFAAINQIYADFFGSHKPARSTVAVKELPKGAKIEIEAIAIEE